MESILSSDLTPRGGTELMADRINTLPASLLEPFQIIHSRVPEDLDPDKKKILVLHDLVGDPMYDHLRDGGWQKFEKLVFVSHWQKQQFQDYLGVPPSAGVVIKNAIQPIEDHEKEYDKIRLIYFSTPHRGLDILYAAFNQLSKEFDNIELNVFSSFELYGWPERDKQYQGLFDKLRGHKAINYHKSVSNERIREELKRSHIFAYPSTWQETSCLCLIEAMSAGLQCVHSSLAALPETAMNLTTMYDYHEDPTAHANTFYAYLRYVVSVMSSTRGINSIKGGMETQRQLANQVYSWKNRSRQWEMLLTNLQ
jgi:UDP-glucose:(glucosyl)LPS alpha-1,2-glucosyltransferase